jgi:hypothetical protein
LACQDEFFVNNPLDAEANDEHALQFALHLQLGGLLLCLRVITVNLGLITSDNPGQEVFIIGGDLMKLLLLISSQKLHQARYMTPNKRT